jgi:hypothetical protein
VDLKAPSIPDRVAVSLRKLASGSYVSGGGAWLLSDRPMEPKLVQRSVVDSIWLRALDFRFRRRTISDMENPYMSSLW